MADNRNVYEDDVYESDVYEEEQTDEPQEQATLIKIYDKEEEQETYKGIKGFFKKIINKVKGSIKKVVHKIAVSKFAKGITIAWRKGIVPALTILFYPLVLFKRKVYDKMSSKAQKTFVSIMFLTPVLIGFIIFYLYPLVMSLIYAFSEVSVEPGKGIVVLFGKHTENGTQIKDIFYNFKELFTGKTGMLPVKNPTTGGEERISLLQALLQTSWTTILDTVVITIFSLLIAVMLNGNFKGRAFARAVFFLPVILNSEAIAAATESTQAIDSMLNSVGSNALTNIFDMKTFMTSVGIPAKLVSFLNGITSTIYSTISYAGVQILIFLAAIQSVPGHLYEAAKIEGATKYEEFWKITLPMVSPMILTVVVYTIVDSFLRSDLNKYIQQLAKNPLYGFHAAASWSYIIVSLAILGLALVVLKKVVFYYDEK